jgi:hypothetical protein
MLSLNLLSFSSFKMMDKSEALTTVFDSLNGGTCVTSFQPGAQWGHRFISGGGTITEIVMMIAGSSSFYSSSSIQIRQDASNLPGSVLSTFSPTSISGNLVTYTGSFTSSATTKFWVNPYSLSNPLAWCYFQAGGATPTSATGWSADPTNTSGSKILASTSNYSTWSTGGGGFMIQYKFSTGTSTPDTTAPTFTSSSSFSVAENVATSATAATIRVSESATVTISSGADAARFNIARSETDTAIIKFNVSPDFEAPVDVGGNNVFELTLTATDAASNAGTQSITITVTDVVDTSSFNSLALAGSATTATFRTVVVITANVTVASRITFRVNGKVLPGCKNRLASGSSSSFSATCSWRPSNRGQVSLTAAATPTGAGISSTTSNPVSIMVGKRTGAR